MHYFEIPYPFRASVIWDLATHITIKTHTQKHGCQYFQNLEKLKCNFCLQLNIKKLLWQLFPKGLQACEKSFKIHFCLQILRICIFLQFQYHTIIKFSNQMQTFPELIIRKTALLF